MNVRVYRTDDNGAWVLETPDAVTFLEIASLDDLSECPDCGHSETDHGVRMDGLKFCCAGNCGCGLL